MMQRLRDKLTYGNVVATLALFAALSGTAFAAHAITLPKNSVGSRQIKHTAVTTGKIANNAVTSAKVASHTLTGADINASQLGTVSNATNAQTAQNSDTVGGHAASCPSGTTLIRGVCFDSIANEAVGSQDEAADACAAKGGWLPSPMDLYAIRGVLNLGTGVGSDHRYTDEVYGNTNGTNYRTVVISGNGAISESELNAPSRFICAYPLVR
jgi:hypothetical protein